MRGGLPARQLARPPGEITTAEQWVAGALGALLTIDGAELERITQTAFAEGRVVTAREETLAPDSPAPTALFLHRPVPDEVARPIDLTVVGQGDGWLAIDKPSGLATMPRGSYVARSAVVQARRQFGNDEIVPAHRLDRLTSGVLLLITRAARRGQIQGWFAAGRVTKRYRAVTAPGPVALADGDWHDIRLRLARKDGTLPTLIVPGEPNTHTRVRVIATSEHWQWELIPVTGRTHQLRATLAHLGAPICGDPLYPVVAPTDDPRWVSGLGLRSCSLVTPEFQVSVP